MESGLVGLWPFVVLALAAFRLTHLVVFDKVFAPIRRYFVVYEYVETETHEIRYDIVQGRGLRRWFGEAIACYWCIGMWIAAAVWLAYWLFPGVTLWISGWLALAAVQSLIEAVVHRTSGQIILDGPAPRK